jgi:hypothetical protein
MVATADAGALYVTDGPALLALSAGTVQPLGTFSASPYALLDAGAYIAATEYEAVAPICCTTFETLAKADGTVAVAGGGYTSMQLVAASDAGLVFTGDTQIVAGLSQPDEGYLVASPTGTTLGTTGGRAVGLVASATSRLDQPPALVGLMTCTANLGLAVCVAGPVSEFDVATGLSTSLGTVPGTPPVMSASLTDGLVGAFAVQTDLPYTQGNAGETNQRDAWQVTPGLAGSLQRITNNVP